MKAKKKAERLQKRINAWQNMPLNEAKVANRYENGGYKCPGSRNR